MQSVAEQIASLPHGERNKILATLTDAEAEALLHDWEGFLARPDQIAPKEDWDIWLILAGRGWGKTRTGAEWVKARAKLPNQRIALVGETQKDLEQVMVEGVSGILSLYGPNSGIKYKKKPVEIIFPNGSIALGYNATEPDQLRGPQFTAAWCDELAKWRHARKTWDQLQFGLRLGDHPQQIITTTPQPIQIVKDIFGGKEGSVVVTRGKTSDNRSNLSAKFLDKVNGKYANTRLGRQELNGEILGDMPGALWAQSSIDIYRASEIPKLGRIVVSVDPAVTNTENSDEHGIVVAGLLENQAYVIEDGSTRGSPLDWARRAISLYDEYGADGIVVEVNQGGDMVAQTLRSVREELNIIEVRASRGKHVRAAPIASLYEQGRVSHFGSFPELESQMTQMTASGYQGNGSPDRLDALVWALTELFPGIIAPIEPDYTPPIRDFSGIQ